MNTTIGVMNWPEMQLNQSYKINKSTIIIFQNSVLQGV